MSEKTPRNPRIDSMELSQNGANLIITCDSGDIEFSIPLRGKSLDVVRSTIKINVSKKYTLADIHILQQIVFDRLGVSSSIDEIEPE